MKAYSKEMRRAVLAACQAGHSTREVALSFGCSESWVRRVKQQYREQGKTAPCTTRKRTPRWQVYRQAIEQHIAKKPDLTLRELKEELGTSLSLATLCNALKQLKLTLKKKS